MQHCLFVCTSLLGPAELQSVPKSQEHITEFKRISLLPQCKSTSQRLSNMQAVMLFMDMCCSSCAYSNPLSLCLQQVRTGDLGGYATSDEFTRAVVANLPA